GGLPRAKYDFARGKMGKEKESGRSDEKKLGERAEVVLKRLFAEGISRQSQKIVFEVIQIPRDRLTIKAAPRVADFVVQITSGLDLKSRQGRNRFSVGFDDCSSNILALAIL